MRSPLWDSRCAPFACAAWLILCLCLPGGLLAAEHFVSPQGTTTGDGTRERPWDLPTALAPAPAIQPGDTLWLLQGVYRGGLTSRLAGRPDAPVIVRAALGARVTIDLHPRDDQDPATFYVLGGDVVFRNFEVMSSHPARETEIAGSWPADMRRGSVDVRADRVCLYDLVVHDLGSGFGFWSEGEGGEIAGCLIYNNGWRGPDRAHGHGIYAQNARGVKRLRDNIVFHQAAYGVHAYGSEKSALRGFEIDGNITFDNGALGRRPEQNPGIFLGGATPAVNVAIRDNVAVAGGLRLGYTWGTVSEDAVVTGNYSEGGFVLRDFRQATVQNNTFVHSSGVCQLEGEAKLLLAGLKWDHNRYFVTDGRWGEFTFIEQGKARSAPWDEWRRATGFDAHSQFTKGTPTDQRIFVRPLAHHPGRAHVAIVNPTGGSEVPVDLSGVLKAGQKFRIWNAKDIYGPSLITATYDGQPVPLPMQPVRSPPVVGLPDLDVPALEPHFAAFVVQGE